MKRIKNTRFDRIGYIYNGLNNWQFVDIESSNENNIPVRIGQQYRTKLELLADIERFVTERGYN